jgi:alginate O-acetyltransferase complex protein AlgI
LIFNTSWFLIFFLVFYFFLWLVPNASVRFFYLLACCALFHYHFAGAAGVKPIIVMAFVTYFLALWIARLPAGTSRKKWVYGFSLSVPVTGLIFYKYRLLFLGSLGASLGGSLGGWLESHAFQVAMPLAISFFTFEFVHYLTDVYFGSSPIRNPFKFGIFCIFFPSIVSGPIKRFQPFLAQLENGLPRPDPRKAGLGLAQVLLGFFKKLVVADNATILVHLLEKRTDLSFGPICLWMSLLSIRILFDFSGYSDIAIGLGKMIGLDLPVNFNFPYISANIAEFWRRWHMSLSSWIRDYLYIPLGGNRYGTVRKFMNLMVTMFVCGLWHGASWHFGLWGLYHGAGLSLQSSWEKSAAGKKWGSFSASRWIGIGVTNLFVAYGWLLFFYPMDEVLKITRRLLGLA